MASNNPKTKTFLGNYIPKYGQPCIVVSVWSLDKRLIGEFFCILWRNNNSSIRTGKRIRSGFKIGDMNFFVNLLKDWATNTLEAEILYPLMEKENLESYTIYPLGIQEGACFNIYLQSSREVIDWIAQQTKSKILKSYLSTLNSFIDVEQLQFSNQ